MHVYFSALLKGRKKCTSPDSTEHHPSSDSPSRVTFLFFYIYPFQSISSVWGEAAAPPMLLAKGAGATRHISQSAAFITSSSQWQIPYAS